MRSTRLNELIGNNFSIVSYRNLPTSFQLAIAHYMAIDGEAWDQLFDDSVFGAEAAKAALIAVLPDYIQQYGDTVWGMCSISTDAMKKSVMADEEIESSFTEWEEYAAWYTGASPRLNYPLENRWPVILSSYNDETLQDGWHRLHDYIQSGHRDIPAVFYPEMSHRQRAWTTEDSNAAQAQGWDLFLGTIDGVMQQIIERCDEAQVFADDQAALVFVKEQAAAGCSVASKALLLDHNQGAE